MRDLERVLGALTPRVATGALMSFGEVTDLCESRFGRRLSRADRRFIYLVFRSVLVRECRADAEFRRRQDREEC